MTNIWTFSPTSQDLLKACLNSASPQDNDNKWYRKLGRKPLESELVHEKVEQESDNYIKKDIVEVEEVLADRYHEDFTEKKYENFLDNIEANPVANFNELVEECTRNNYLFSVLPLRLSNSAIEKILNHTLNTKSIDIKFVKLTHETILYNFLKQNQSWLSLDLLVKSHKTHPDIFIDLFKTLLQDKDISSKLLQDFIATINEQEKSAFLYIIISLEYNKELFDKNLQLIHATYKDCKINAAIQSCVESIILTHSQDFQNDKNFGKFLLSFLQSQLGIGCLQNCCNIEKVIENHKTPFKKPCVNVLKEIMEKYKV